MVYVLMVSHGEFAPGLHTAVKMIVGDRDNVLSASLKDGMGADAYAASVRQVVSPVQPDDRIVLLADIVGGSPLTTAMKVLDERGLLGGAKIFGGMSLPMALAVILGGEGLDGQALSDLVLSETKDAVQEFVLEEKQEEDEI